MHMFTLFFSNFMHIFLLTSFLYYFSCFFPNSPFISYLSPISGNHGFSRLSTPEIDITSEPFPGLVGKMGQIAGRS